MPDRALRCEILIVAADRDFLHLAAAILTRAGHVVQTTTDRHDRVLRLVQTRTPKVLVLEIGNGLGEQIRLGVAGLAIPMGLVLVADEPHECPVAGFAVLPKWNRAGALVDAVERVIGRPSGQVVALRRRPSGRVS